MNYFRLLLMTILSYISMFILMYIMVDNFSNVFVNLNQFYMAGLMTIPMIIIELIVMQHMYTNKLLNAIITLSSIVLFIIIIFFIRLQSGITDKEFLRSMIPHHASALLMCRAQLQDPEIKSLCANINKTQQDEINFMKQKLKQLESR